jgi:hypothetical protein
MRVLKGVFGCFCALSEPSVRFRINGLRFVSVLLRQLSRVFDDENSRQSDERAPKEECWRQ